MRFAILLTGSLLLAVAGSAHAQAPLFPNGTSRTVAAPHWRGGVDVGIVSGALAPVVVASLDRSWRGPLALGGRAWATISESGFQDDGPTLRGGGGEAFVVARTGDRFLDLRASAGLGVAALDYGIGGLGCEEAFDPLCTNPQGVEGIRPYALGAVGLDVYPFPGVGVGGEVRVAGMQGPANVSSLELGLRVRFAR